MHLSDDLIIVEPVDEAGRPVPFGMPSAKIFLTNLFNLALPLIRFEITDEVTFVDGSCPCGSTHRLVEDVHGRLDDCFVYGGVGTIHPLLFRSPLGQEAGILEYQVRQTSTGAAIGVRCAGEVDLAAVRAKIAAALADRGLVRPTIEIAPVDSFERQSTGKLKRFVPLARSGERR